MLARQENEYPIIEVPLKKKKTLEVTNLKISVFDSKNIRLVIPIQNIRSITPLKKYKIRIQFHERSVDKYNRTLFKRRHIDYDLERPDISALQLCHKIQSEHERLNTWSKNEHGLLIMQPQEHIVITYENVRTNQGVGLLYVTNVGLALETAEGVVFDVPYEKFMLVTDHKKDKIRIIWKDYEWQADRFRHSFDFKLPKDLDRNTVSSLIRTEFSQYRKNTGYEFIQLEKKFGNMSYDKLYNLKKINNPDFMTYINLHVKHTFGFNAVQFSRFDNESIVTCKLAGVDVECIKDISDEEMVQRKESNARWIDHNKIQREIKLQKDELERLEKTCKDAGEFKRLKDSMQYMDTQKALDDIYRNNPELEFHYGEFMSSVLGMACTAADRRTKIIYDEWCKNVPLAEFTDDYDDAWIHYLIGRLNTSQGHDPIEPRIAILTYGDLQEELKVRDRNRMTVSNFSAPDDIPKEHIYNNCWYDQRHKMYYVQDDNLSEKLQNLADSDPDSSQTMIGRRVWGFEKECVRMFCGFPSVKVETPMEDHLRNVTIIRKTGMPLTEVIYKMRNFILPILREDDINEEMAEKFGALSYTTTEIQIGIKQSGMFDWFTPKMLKMYGRRFGFADIPLNERVRRALFAVECDGVFDVQVSLESEYV